jgi:hypothetical protein
VLEFLKSSARLQAETKVNLERVKHVCSLLMDLEKRLQTLGVPTQFEKITISHASRVSWSGLYFFSSGKSTSPPIKDLQQALHYVENINAQQLNISVKIPIPFFSCGDIFFSFLLRGNKGPFSLKIKDNQHTPEALARIPETIVKTLLKYPYGTEDREKLKEISRFYESSFLQLKSEPVFAVSETPSEKTIQTGADLKLIDEFSSQNPGESESNPDGPSSVLDRTYMWMDRELNEPN